MLDVNRRTEGTLVFPCRTVESCIRTRSLLESKQSSFKLKKSERQECQEMSILFGVPQTFSQQCDLTRLTRPSHDMLSSLLPSTPPPRVALWPSSHLQVIWVTYAISVSPYLAASLIAPLTSSAVRFSLRMSPPKTTVMKVQAAPTD